MKRGERYKIFTRGKKSQGPLETESCVKVTASSFSLGDGHMQLLCFSEQLLKSFDACHRTICSYFFDFSVLATYRTFMKQSSQSLKRNSSLSFELWEWRMWMH